MDVAVTNEDEFVPHRVPNHKRQVAAREYSNPISDLGVSWHETNLASGRSTDTPTTLAMDCHHIKRLVAAPIWVWCLWLTAWIFGHECLVEPNTFGSDPPVSESAVCGERS